MNTSTFVTCTCGKRFKDNSAMAQHQQDAPRHQQQANEAPGNNVSEILQNLSLQEPQVDAGVIISPRLLSLG
jgi:hypothetical protein